MRFMTVVGTVLTGLIGTLPLVAQQTPTAVPGSALAIAKYGKLPMTFEANEGQANPHAKFVSRGAGYTAILTTTGMVLSLRPGDGLATQTPDTTYKNGNTQSPASSTLEFRLVGAAPNPQVIGEDPQPGKVNYFIGNNPAKWHTNVPTYGRIRYKNIYPGIDLVYYGNHRQLEYDFAISPGADLSKIQFEIVGANQIQLDTDGNLILRTSSRELHFKNPEIYQESNGTRVPVPGAYVVNDPTHVSFHVAQHDLTRAVVIDPVLIYSSYLGGSGFDQPYGLAVDNTGALYVAGFTESADFPLATLGSLPAGAAHVFISKFDPTGANLLYSDYLGGNGQDYGFGLVLDSANEVYVTGSTASSDFPVVNPYQGTYPGSFNGFLTKISADGSSLLYSTYLGGNGSDMPAGIAIDSLSEVLIAGNTSSTNFPVVNAYQTTASPNQGGIYGNYGFLTKFSTDGSSLVYSTYFAGNSNVPYNCGGTPCWSSPFSAVTGLALDANGNAYTVGTTNTYNFPTTSGGYLTTNTTSQNAFVGFVSKFSTSGVLNYSTYFYESSGVETDLSAVVVDGSGSAYVTGSAYSDGTFPITSTSICDPGVYGSACGFAFVTKFDPSGATLLYSTFLGPNNNANPSAMALDADNDVYVLASTASASFVGVDGIEPYSNGSDLLLVEIDPLASTELFATYIGGSSDEFSAGIAVDSNGYLYVSGSTTSTDFPVTLEAFQDLAGGDTDAFVLKIGPSSAPAVSAIPVSLEYSSQGVGSTSPAQTVLLRNMGSSALTISSIAAGGDFAESDNCGTNVAAAGSCTLSVTFTPTSPGTRTGSVLIQDDAAASPHVIALSGIGSGPGTSLNPANLFFAVQSVGNSSSTQTVTVTNSGNATLSVGTIQTTGDFSQINNCPSNLAAGSSCSVNVTFTPTAAGVRDGILSVNDNAQGSPQTGALSGTGSISIPPIAALTPASLAFSTQPLGTSSAAKSVTITNTGTATLDIASIQIRGDYTQTNNCGSQLPSASNCTVRIMFSPKATGTRNGTLTLTDNAQGSPQFVSVSGSSSDFIIDSSASQTAIKAGASATYTISVSPVGGSFPDSVSLTCSGLPAQATCTFLPETVTPGATGGTSTLTITTTQSSSQRSPVFPSNNSPAYAMFIRLQGIGLVGIVLAGSRKRYRRQATFTLMTLTVLGTLFMSGCAGGTGIAPQTSSGTTYNVTVTGTTGTVHHSVPLTLTVE